MSRDNSRRVGIWLGFPVGCGSVTGRCSFAASTLISGLYQAPRAFLPAGQPPLRARRNSGQAETQVVLVFPGGGLATFRRPAVDAVEAPTAAPEHPARAPV